METIIYRDDQVYCGSINEALIITNNDSHMNIVPASKLPRAYVIYVKYQTRKGYRVHNVWMDMYNRECSNIHECLLVGLGTPDTSYVNRNVVMPIYFANDFGICGMELFFVRGDFALIVNTEGVSTFEIFDIKQNRLLQGCRCCRTSMGYISRTIDEVIDEFFAGKLFTLNNIDTGCFLCDEKLMQCGLLDDAIDHQN